MNKKKIKTSNIALIFVAIILVIFTGLMIITYNRVGGVPDTLVVSVFACLGTETGMLAWIRNSKLRYENDEMNKLHFEDMQED